MERARSSVVLYSKCKAQESACLARVKIGDSLGLLLNVGDSRRPRVRSPTGPSGNAGLKGFFLCLPDGSIYFIKQKNIFLHGRLCPSVGCVPCSLIIFFIKFN